MVSHNLNLFQKTRYSLSEEDRMINAFLIVLQDGTSALRRSFLTELGIILRSLRDLQIRDHIPYDPYNIVDAEIKIADELLIIIEAKLLSEQFEDSDQVIRYFEILKKRSEQKRLLLLCSPDSIEPFLVQTIRPQTPDCYIVWRSWTAIFRWLKTYFEFSEDTSEVEEYLVKNFLEYVDSLNLVRKQHEERDKGMGLDSRLKYILGNTTAEKCLMHVYHHNGAHTRQIARDHNIDADSVNKQLRRFEKAGVLRREKRGRTVVYFFNEKCPFIPEIISIIRKVYDKIPDRQRKRIFEPRYKLDSNQ